MAKNMYCIKHLCQNKYTAKREIYARASKTIIENEREVDSSWEVNIFAEIFLTATHCFAICILHPKKLSSLEEGKRDFF